MYVRQLVGSRAGTIVEMAYDVAKTAIENGTAEPVTVDELAEVDLTEAEGPIVDSNDIIPNGYRVEPDAVTGFNVFDAGGVSLNKQPFPNMPAARCYAQTHYYHATHQSEIAETKAKRASNAGRPVGGSKAAAAALAAEEEAKAAAEAEAAALAAAEAEAKAKADAAGSENSQSQNKEGEA